MIFINLKKHLLFKFNQEFCAYYDEKYPYWTEEKMQEMAAKLAQKRFEEMS